MVSAQVVGSVPRTLSRWRHGSNPRWDYDEKPQVTSRITAAPVNVVYEPITPSSPVTALESAIAPETRP